MNHPKLRLSIPWDQIEESAQKQITNVLRMPELEKLAIMPDVHAGYDLCIGGVALLRGHISPSFVGYDIGCGMCHINTGLTVHDFGIALMGEREHLFHKLRAKIPAGVGKTQDYIYGNTMSFASACGDKNLDLKVAHHINYQLGTLGSGNHFLEIGVNNAGVIGITVHSGSRRAGYDIADYYMKQARIFSLDSELGKAYATDMNWALSFALENRRHMLTVAMEIMGLSAKQIRSFVSAMINENHNHASILADNLVLHRKGATPADSGQLGVIPANQRDGVWITRGLGNTEFLSSASHGAGRTMSRKAASKQGTETDLAALMEGVVCRTDQGVLNEAPWAYKNIDAVLAAQNGIMVDVIDHFKPIIVLKG